MSFSLVTTALALSLFGAPPAGKPVKAAKPRADSCPVVGTANTDSSGHVSNYQGLPLKAGGVVVGYDADGKLGALKVSGNGIDMRFSEGVPGRIKSLAFARLLVVDKSLGSSSVMSAGEDLPSGIEPEQVQILLGDGSKARAVLFNESVDGQPCETVSVKGASGWKRCWGSCAAP